jgi:superfamily I DNA/RNA helicase
VFALYLRYEDVLKIQGLWDDADFTLDLLRRSKLKPLSTQYDKVYVDEVQDNTQAEIVLYFLAAGMNTQSLFLAGDPAQSVVEGVDFRFEDVRSIVYKLSYGEHNINRPMKLFVNYRSHAGVLNCACALLGKMFVMFPGAANVLPKDVGLFKGPRPACSQVDEVEGLAKLLVKNERLVVLCADEEVVRVDCELTRMNIKNTVLGIRAAKGLEFVDVVVLDFFSSIPSKDYQAWKSLFTSENVVASTTHPHIELQLKLLYTAVTRSCNRLLFVETEKTQLSSVMFRWMVGAGLAEMYNAADESTVLMTSDEWRVQGIEFALSAEGENTVMFLEKALKCFTLANDETLLTRCAAELQLVQARLFLSSFKNHIINRHEVKNAVKVILEGLRVGLREEVRELCKALQSKVAYGEIFGFEIVKRLH